MPAYYVNSCHLIKIMPNSSIRLLLLLQSIPREPHFISSQDLRVRMQSAGFSVSLRTIQRDLLNLSAYFPLIQNVPQGRGKTGVGWAFTRASQRIAFPSMDRITALTLAMAMQHLKPLLPPQVLQHLQPLQQEAEIQLTKHNAAKYQNWLNKVRVEHDHILQPAQVDAEAVEFIYQALLENRQFCATYKGKPQRIVHPYGLVQQGHTLYLLCRFYAFDDIRITALHRYQQVEILDAAVRPFAEFNIDDYLEKGALQWLLPEKQTINLKLRLTAYMADHLLETHLAANQQVIADEQHEDSFILTAEVLDGMQLRRWLLSQGKGLVVLEPINLRNWIKETLYKQLSQYN